MEENVSNEISAQEQRTKTFKGGLLLLLWKGAEKENSQVVSSCSKKGAWFSQSLFKRVPVQCMNSTLKFEFSLISRLSEINFQRML